MFRQSYIILIIIIIIFTFVSIINTQNLPLCESLNDIDDNNNKNSEIKSRRVRAICDAISSSRVSSDNDEFESIPDFDLTQMNSDNDVNQILKRYRRGRSSSSSSGSRSSSSSSRSSSGGSRFSSSFSRSGSSSSGSSSGSRFFGGSRSSSSSSGGSSRIFSRSSPSSSGSGSSSSGTGSRFFSRSSGSSSSGTGSRISSPSSGSSSSSSSSGKGVRIFSRTPSSSNTGSRVRNAIRSMIHKPSSPGKGIPSASGGLAGTGGSKPGLSDKIRKITSGGGGAFGSRTGGSGGGFGVAGSSGSGGNAWVRAGKKFLPHAVNFGKRYYQRRKYSKGMYAGMGAGAGYYAGSRMNNHNNHNNHYYPQDNYGYPPVVDTPPDQINGKAPTVFYCIQENLNATLVNQTLNAEGFGVCNISGELIECPLEIECKTDESDTCCEDEQGAPFCCGGAIPEEYSTQYGGYADDMYDAAESINKILNIITTIALLLTTICFTMWHQQGQ
ncbi:unnamed protein product [Adineta steineri]|uniref:Uncharacterized protein n=1 Tax=Adineta steineri TaxID=433720 RepID=A0A815S3D3_9BILA|nr:unnamed protein product [Adineta steineri]CAF1639790.1 unnamed protein product [Adineta steineri]